MSGEPENAGHRSRSSPPGSRVSAALLGTAAVTALTLGVGFGSLLLGVEDFWVAFPLGFGVVLPAALGFVTYVWADGDDQDGHRREADSRNSLEQLRMRYARGELSDAEFERRLDRLLESSDAR